MDNPFESRFEQRCRTTSVEDAAAQIGINRKYAYELIKRGEFPVRTIRIGRRIVVPRAELDALLGVQTEDKHESH